jgi:hypothetical protein
MTLPFQVRVLVAWTCARQRVVEAIDHRRDDRGELTAGVIFLVALAVAAVAVAAIVVAKINDHADEIP